jgi:very-short-patch-repair endonuclease
VARRLRRETTTAIEVDGGQHGTARVEARDKRRTLWLRAHGVTVLRFWNNEVLENIEGVWEEISRCVVSLKRRHATPTLTLPLSGGGKRVEIDR